MKQEKVAWVLPNQAIEFLGNAVGSRLIMDGTPKRDITKADMRQAANHLPTVDVVEEALHYIETSFWFRDRIRYFARNYINSTKV